MLKKFGSIAFALVALSGCTDMKPTDFSDTRPVLRIEDYFDGQTKAWGIFEDRFGDLRRQFVVDIQGTWDGTELVLDERFLYSDGESNRRVWTIRKIDDHNYEGSADDVIGTAKGQAYGNALNWRYDMDLNIGESTLRVHFNDWMFLQEDGILVNRARVSKFGIEIGEVTLFFQKSGRQVDGVALAFSQHIDVAAEMRAAGR